MKNRLFRWIILSGLGLTAACCAAQQPAGPDGNRPAQATPPPTEGFWPTRVMLDRFIDRITDDVGERYKFDEEQLENTKQLFKEAFPRFLNENRAEIQTLMNEFMEAQLNDQAPAVADVAHWAQRALPLISKFSDMANDTADKMREYMTEDQQIILQGELAAFNTGIKLMNNKLGVWSDGGYDPESEWPRNAANRDRRRAEERRMQAEVDAARQQALAQAGGSPNHTPPAAIPAPPATANTRPGEKPETQPAKPAPPLDEWARYVEDFIKRYKLDEAQRSQAHKILEAKKQDRTQYLLKRSKDLDRVDQLLKDAKTEVERAQAKTEADKLRAPIERYFQELKDRLEKIPTRNQRIQATQTPNPDKTAKDPAKSEGPPAGGTKTEGPSSP